MIDTCLTGVYLESLSADELLKLADKYGVEIPAGLERIKIIEALLESVFGDEDHTESVEDIQSDFLEAAALPVHYNISFINVMIRDPLRAYVFWEIKNHDRQACENASDFEGYCLKVIPLKNSGPSLISGAHTGGPGEEDSFIVPLSANDTGRYLSFPPAEACYQVELCAVHGENCIPLIVSAPFRMPKLFESSNQRIQISPEYQEIYHNPLACLSGAGEFPVIRNIDRQVRNREHKCCESGT
jgi:hypothetical protein